MTGTKNFHFVSFVGETTVATFLPYIGYTKIFGEPLSVILLATDEVEERMPVLKDKIKAISSSIDIQHIKLGPYSKIDIKVVIPRLYSELEDKYTNLAVNMSGGTKALIFTAVFSLKHLDHIFLQMNNEFFFASRLIDDKLRHQDGNIDIILPVQDLLELQMINYIKNKSQDNQPPWDLKETLNKYKVSPPEDSLYNVIIDNKRVDCVWNPGNNILSLLFINNSTKKTVRDDSRRILSSSSTKEWLANLYNRNIYAIDAKNEFREYYEDESGGKVNFFPFSNKNIDYKIKEQNKQSLISIFKPFKANKLTGKFKKPVWNNIERERTLVTALGSFSEATILAINTHKCPQVVLLCISEDDWVREMAQNIQRKAHELGLKRVFLLETDYSARNCFAHLPEEIYDIAEVNITPGTKPQATALGLWAIKNNIPAWTIDRDKIVRLGPYNEEKPVVALSLKNRLDFISTAKVTNYGWNKDAKDWNDDFYPNMLNFMNNLIDKDNNINKLKSNFYSSEIIIDNFAFKICDGGYWEFVWPSQNDPSKNNSRQFLWSEGYWYEKLVAKAVDSLNSLKGNVKFDVACGIKVSADVSNNTLTERDVIVVNSKAQVFLISCKTKKTIKFPDDDQLIYETIATAKTLGRFVVPIICSMTHNEPSIHCIPGSQNKVCVFGWTTVCRPTKLLKALEFASKELLNP
jgi:hypothetical protein